MRLHGSFHLGKGKFKSSHVSTIRWLRRVLNSISDMERYLRPRTRFADLGRDSLISDAISDVERDFRPRTRFSDVRLDYLVDAIFRHLELGPHSCLNEHVVNV